MKAVHSASAVVILILTTVSLHAVDDPDSKGPANAELDLKEHRLQTRTLVWAKPGASGIAFDPENWTEYASTDGKRTEYTDWTKAASPNRTSSIGT